MNFILLFDIKHIAHVNFFKPLINKLENTEIKVIISYIDRGKLPRIVKAEFPNVNSFSVGRHNGGIFSIFVEANIMKFFNSLLLIRRFNVNLVFGVDAFVSGLACNFLRIPNVQFYDDPERTLNLLLERVTSTELYYPAITDFSGTGVKVYNALKEWAYLSPDYFSPSESPLKVYGVTSGNYLFVREVADVSLNYKGQGDSIIASFSDSFPRNIPVLLSLENKANANRYPSTWTVLQEPIDDIHSLMYNSRAVISSGDSMAREGAMLGVPSFYVGFRDMAANRFIQREGRFFTIDPSQLKDTLKQDFSSFRKTQDQYRAKLKSEWVDVTEMMYQLVMKYYSRL